MEIRQARWAELEALRALQKTAHGTAWDEEIWKEQFGEERALVWVVDDPGKCRLAALLVAWRALNSIEIVDVAVAPRYRRRGIASAMLNTLAAVAGANGVERIVLEVREDNEPAIATYQNLGYRRLGRRSDFYDNGTAAEVMEFRPPES